MQELNKLSSTFKTIDSLKNSTQMSSFSHNDYCIVQKFKVGIFAQSKLVPSSSAVENAVACFNVSNMFPA